jgi:putative transcriptional regulator
MMKQRDLGNEILESLRDIKAGHGKKQAIGSAFDIASIRKGLHLSQASFSTLMGISLRTLQEWEQGRRKPTGPAISLLRIAQKHPEAFTDL